MRFGWVRSLPRGAEFLLELLLLTVFTVLAVEDELVILALTVAPLLLLVLVLLAGVAVLAVTGPGLRSLGHSVEGFRVCALIKDFMKTSSFKEELLCCYYCIIIVYYYELLLDYKL